MIPAHHDLTYFLEVANTKNLSRAAERLGISQPSVSLAIQRLEQTLGTPVLIRSPKGVQLTRAGKQLQVHGRSLIQSWEALRGQALASVDQIQGSFRLGCHPSVAIYSLPLFLREVLEKHPLLEIQLAHGLSRELTEQVVQLEVDLGICINPSPHPDLVIHKLARDEVQFWKQKNLSKTLSKVLIHYPKLIQGQELIKKYKQKGLTFDRVVTSSNLEVVAKLTQAGIGVGLLPARVAKALPGEAIRALPGTPKYLDKICLIYRVENKGLKAIQALASAIRSAFR